ncbi:hypothetical protein CANMA_005139 [Candida margitis]|uniref:uncharacterized protein n=1 Tax=Candida margitis TaxID=1775924 RepID=UPI002226DC15|nr:uncharacterized protein CANMA_005139 [Candida margitis]KAI5952060.1 hypothetical protein CANMA_005139 [Candida margitis]
MHSSQSLGAKRDNNRFYSYPNYTNITDVSENKFAADSSGSFHRYAENIKQDECMDNSLPQDKDQLQQQISTKPSSFYPLQEADVKPENKTLPSKISKFSKFLNRFKHKPSKSTGVAKKYNTVTGVNIAPTNEHSVPWRRRFSRHHTTMFNLAAGEKSLPSDSFPETNMKPILDAIFSPPVKEPMKTIESLEYSNKVIELNESITRPRTKSLSLSSFYNNSFFSTAVRKPISYDNSQITDETIVVQI